MGMYIRDASWEVSCMYVCMYVTANNLCVILKRLDYQRHLGTGKSLGMYVCTYVAIGPSSDHLPTYLPTVLPWLLQHLLPRG